ncbi:BrnT family toxin [Novosphingobium sp.]|uniref:BrnT family toxin n=1 Tax=Novosphingobium sp. TaxID=1874826 RepID=UPI0037044771
MEIEYDPAKRDLVLAARGLDIARCGDAFEGFHTISPDHRHSASEQRFLSTAQLDETVVIIAWTPRGTLRRIITMWKANDRERKSYRVTRERSG